MFDGNDLPHESWLTLRERTKLRNVFDNNIPTDIKLSKAQISKIIQSGEFLGSLLSKIAGPLIKVAVPLGSLLSKIAGPLMKVAVPLAKNILAILGITAAASAIDAGIQKKVHGSGITTLTISNQEMDGWKLFKLLKILIFYWNKSLKQLKMNQKNKTTEF